MGVDLVTTDGNTGSAFNRFNCANNNPYRFTDPDGRLPDTPELPKSPIPPPADMKLLGQAIYKVLDTLSQPLQQGLNAIINSTSGDSGSNSPPLPDKLVGTVDDKSGQQGGRVNNGPLAPGNGGTGDAAKDFGNLTGGKTGEAGKYPGVRGENGIGLRPGKEG